MTRDKQLVVRLENEEREKFKQFCQDNQLEMSSFLYELVRNFNNGSLTLDQIMTSTASGLDSEGIDSLKKSLMAEVDARIEAVIASLNPVTVTPLKEDGTGDTVTPPKKVSAPVAPTKEGGLTCTELAKLWERGKSTISTNANNGLDSFQKWSAKNSPDRRPWTFEGEGNDRRFYPMEVNKNDH